MTFRSVFRSTILGVSTAMLLPMIHSYGHVFTSCIISALVLASFGYGNFPSLTTLSISELQYRVVYLTIIYGESMRDWVDIGYSNPENN